MPKKAKAKARKEAKSEFSQTIAIVCLLLNVLILPGLGTIIARTTQKRSATSGVWQLVLFIVGIPLIFALGFGLLVMLAAWIWALVESIEFLKEAE